MEPAASHPVPVIKVLVTNKHVFNGVESLIKVAEVGGRNIYEDSVSCVILSR